MRVLSLSRPCPLRGAIAASALLVCAASPTVARAQDAPAHVAYVDGAASIDRETDSIDAVAGEPLVPGDRLRTESGRAEVWFPDGSTLALDAYTSAELQSASLIRLTSGSVILVVARSTDVGERGEVSGRYARRARRSSTGRVNTRSPWPATAAIRNSSSRSFAASAQLVADGGSMGVRSGERTFARANTAPSYPQVFNSARRDAFDDWAATLRDRRRGRAESTRYLPSNLQMYGGTFDRYGAWDYEACVWQRLVSRRGSRVASVLQRLLASVANVRMDMDRHG